MTAPWWRRRWALVIAVLTGVALGLLARDVPVWLAIEVAARGVAGADCGDQSILACALDNMDEVMAVILRFFVALVVIGAVAAITGIAFLVMGVLRRQPALLVAGTTLVVPVLWQAGSITWQQLT